MYNHVNKDNEEAERAYFKSVIRQVVDYVKVHFATEERIMQKAKFQGYLAHKKVHDDFILSVVDTIQKFEEGKKVPLSSFTHFIRDWILTHIAIMDKQYFEYFLRIASRNPDGKLTVTVSHDEAIAC
jgi:hemerythrin